MKKLLLLIAVFTFSFGNAQTGMLNGTGYAPDITVTDLNGNSHNLYSYLNSGKIVVLELFSTTCGHCQQYAAGTENAYQTYGPSGMDVAEFIGLEVNSSSDSIDVANFATTYGVGFPLCNNISPTAINYQLYYTPSYYVIYPDSSYVTFCPAYCQTTSSSSTIENLLNTAIQSWIPPIYGCTDPIAVNYNPLATTDDGTCNFTSYLVATSGVSFTPDTIICDVGDTINFNLGGYHNAVEVSNSTWIANGTTSNGGFSIGFGQTGQFIPTTAQTHYYVCTPHVNLGMKGVIIANALPISGCTDTAATNYNQYATVDDGNCVYPCTDNEVVFTGLDQGGDTWNGGMYYITNSLGDTVATGDGMGAWYDGNYGFGPLNTFDDTLCFPTGCYDLTFTAGNWASEMVFKFAPFNGISNYAFVGAYTDISIGGAVCGIINGCTDSTAINYDPTVTVDDSSCAYATVCTKPFPTGLYIDEVVHSRVRVNWDNMTDAVCLPKQYRIQYREVGTTSWSQKNALDAGLCNFGLSSTSKNLTPLSSNTTYEYRMKAWYCNTVGASSWSALHYFTTAPDCPNVINFAVSTPTTTKATFTWDTTAAYSFVRVKLRVDSVSNPTGSDWFTAGGFGINYPTLTKDKNNLIPGETYRGQARTWCSPVGGFYRSAAWTSLVWWTQPNSIRISNPDSKDRKLVIITDLLGREVNPKKVIDNTTLFYIYSDGTVEKRIVIE